MEEVSRLQAQLLRERPLRVLLSSTSSATQALLCTMLKGFSVTTVSSTQEAENYILNVQTPEPVDFVVLDDQSEARVDDFTRVLRASPLPSLKDTKIVHLFTPTTDNLADHPILKPGGDGSAGIIRVTKPPRQARLLQTLASLKNLPPQAPLVPIMNASAVREEEALARRTLHGNVLVAEGWSFNGVRDFINSCFCRQSGSSETPGNPASKIPA